jgi:hypothetical protein
MLVEAASIGPRREGGSLFSGKKGELARTQERRKTEEVMVSGWS